MDTWTEATLQTVLKGYLTTICDKCWWSCPWIKMGELECYSGVSTRLPPHCLGFDSSAQCHKLPGLSFIVGSCPYAKGILWKSLVPPILPLHKNKHFQIPIWSGIHNSTSSGFNTSNHVYIKLIYFLYLISMNPCNNSNWIKKTTSGKIIWL